MANNSKAARLETSGAASIVKLLASLPEDVQDTLDETSREIAGRTAGMIQAVAFSDSKQSRLVAPSIVAAYSKVPTIVAGGRQRIPSHQAAYNDLFYGANFGSYDFPQFEVWAGAKKDYWFFETFYNESPRMVREWAQGVEDLAALFNGGGE